MSMWDDVKINTKGDLQHYMNNALLLASTNTEIVEMIAMDVENPMLARAAKRLENAVHRFESIRDELAKKLPDSEVEGFVGI